MPGAVAAGDAFGDLGEARIVGIEAWRETRPFGGRADEEEREVLGVEVDGDPAAAAHGVGDGDRAVGFAAERKITEKGPALAERRLRDLVLPGCGGGGQRMPLLIAVAMAMARLLADSFWIAWVM